MLFIRRQSPAQSGMTELGLAGIRCLHQLGVGPALGFVPVSAEMRRREQVTGCARPDGAEDLALARTMATRAQTQPGFATGRRPCDDIDQPTGRTAAVGNASGALDDLDAFDVLNRHRHVEIVVAGLRIAQRHAVDQNQRLFIGRAADTDVGLNTRSAAPTDLYAADPGQQLPERGRRHGLDLFTSHYRNGLHDIVKRVHQRAGGHQHRIEGRCLAQPRLLTSRRANRSDGHQQPCGEHAKCSFHAFTSVGSKRDSLPYLFVYGLQYPAGFTRPGPEKTRGRHRIDKDARS